MYYSAGNFSRKENDMTQEEKELLIRDLCSRLPYMTKVQIVFIDNYKYDKYLNCSDIKELLVLPKSQVIKTIKPYLYPISAMTNEQQNELIKQGIVINFKGFGDISSSVIDMAKWIDWLNLHHFDYRGLIDKGLAIDITTKIPIIP